ncbi:MAG: UDP-glucuronic acid decarboxylase family protein [Marmoricola sp.]
MLVLITGGAGFLGSHLCTRILDEGHRVVCADNYVTGLRANVEHLLGRDGFELVEVDVSDRTAFLGALAGRTFDLVLHFASPASPIDYLELPIETMKVGSLGTFNSLDLARDSGARFVIASTSETYGDPQVHPQPESYWGHVNPVGPRGVYDEAKRFGEAATAAYRRSLGTNTGIVRIFNTFGPRMRPNDGRAIPAFVSQALAGRPLTVAGDGTQTRSICYVDDLVEGIWRLAQSDLPGPVNIGNPTEISMLDLARWIVRLTGSTSEITFIDRPVDDPGVRRPDITLAREALGWEPVVPVEDGLLRTIEWFRAQPQSASS